jgi:D-glycero-D-manno-heptose 1,7-bisphosphate phosphatase
MPKIVFLDRDGVINHDPGDYTTSLEEFHVLPGVYDALRKFIKHGYLPVIITNQGGVALGRYTLSEVERIHDWFLAECENENCAIAGVYASPHHPSVGNSLSRKPERLMIERALHRFKASSSDCIMIGDKERDIDAAAAAGVKGLLIPVNGSLLEAANLICD